MFKDSFTPEIKQELTDKIANVIVHNKSFIEMNIITIFYSKCAELFPNESVFTDTYYTCLDSAIISNLFTGKKEKKSVKLIAQNITENLVDIVDENVETIKKITAK